MPTDAPQTTPLHEIHVALGAKMVPFAGFDMPVHYTGILDEHRAVREAAGLFDVSHMGEFRLRGPDAVALAHQLVTNDATKLVDGKAMYAVLCREDGTAVDDLLVYRIAEDDVMLVVNASNMQKDWDHIEAVRDRQLDVEVTNASDEMALLALQGPRAFEVFEAATGLSMNRLNDPRLDEGQQPLASQVVDGSDGFGLAVDAGHPFSPPSSFGRAGHNRGAGASVP